MKLNISVNTPTIDNDGKIAANISCSELGASSKVEIDFINLLPFASVANKNAVDLFLIASFVYGVDRFIDRHTYSTDGWSRELAVTFPVYNPQLWSELTDKTEQLLSFLTGDYWTVKFISNDLILPASEIGEIYKAPFSQVNLFSGGLDSLIGALNFLKLNPNEKLLTVSHFDPHISARQEQIKLREKLSEKYPNGFKFIPSVSVSLAHSQLEKEKTFRSRSLLFISIAVLVADYQQLSVMVPENGTVSLNLPLSASRRSACSTRTTHPTFLQHVRELLNGLCLNSSVENIYDLKTKGEMVNECEDLDFLKTIVAISNSCGKRGHRANWTHTDKDHCGVCMPCIYRQAALQLIADPTGYGNSIKKGFTGRHNQTPFLSSKQGQDFNACLDFLKKNLSDNDIRGELLINGVKDLTKLDGYVELVKRTRAELKEWIEKAGNNNLKQRAGII